MIEDENCFALNAGQNAAIEEVEAFERQYRKEIKN